MVKISQRQRDGAAPTRKSPIKTKSSNILRQITSVLLIGLFLLMPLQDALAAKPKQSESSENSKYASIVIDAETGTVISQRYADKKLHPASLTKVMTLLMLFEAMESGSVRLNDRIRISQKAASQAPSKIGLSAGSSIRVEDAILSLVTKSANDISVAIAEHLAGSESRFAQRMTSRAHSIGMNSTRFVNASGLHNPGQISTARDMATLARYVIHRYPNYYRYFGTKQFTYRGKTMTNHNRLMNTYPGMDGFKTGYVNASGFNLIASAKRNNNRLIGVVFGGRTSKSRNDHMAEILNSGFSRVDDIRVAAKTKPIQGLQPAQVTDVEPGSGTVTTAAMVPPPVKPVFRTTSGSAGAAQNGILQLPAGPQNNQNGVQDFTSLSSLDSRKVAVSAQGFSGEAIPVTPEKDVAEQAAADIKSAVAHGDYSDVTGQGDNDLSDTRRVEAGLLSAAVYKGEHIAPKPQIIAHAPPAPASDLWSIQIGAYASRVATDDALRAAHTRLPATLAHATKVVAPLETSAGYLFRARLGGLTKDQAVLACQYFRDCLPVSP
jgi:D-alanyl-D-alanine carboxypeptidase